LGITLLCCIHLFGAPLTRLIGTRSALKRSLQLLGVIAAVTARTGREAHYQRCEKRFGVPSAARLHVLKCGENTWRRRGE
jgi:hypothetical protein